MKKLTLRMDELAVESFAIRTGDGTRGTVRAHDESDTFQETCYNSCGGTCRYNTCNVPWQCP